MPGRRACRRLPRVAVAGEQRRHRSQRSRRLVAASHRGARLARRRSPAGAVRAAQSDSRFDGVQWIQHRVHGHPCGSSGHSVNCSTRHARVEGSASQPSVSSALPSRAPPLAAGAYQRGLRAGTSRTRLLKLPFTMLYAYLSVTCMAKRPCAAYHGATSGGLWAVTIGDRWGRHLTDCVRSSVFLPNI